MIFAVTDMRPVDLTMFWTVTGLAASLSGDILIQVEFRVGRYGEQSGSVGFTKRLPVLPCNA